MMLRISAGADERTDLLLDLLLGELPAGDRAVLGVVGHFTRGDFSYYQPQISFGIYSYTLLSLKKWNLFITSFFKAWKPQSHPSSASPKKLSPLRA